MSRNDHNLIVKTALWKEQILRYYVGEGDLVIDATAGNGNDCLLLAQLVGSRGRVFGFDIQEEALRNSDVLLSQAGLLGRCVLIHASHSEMTSHLPEESHGWFSAVVFNLGYLPGGDKTITTQQDTTLTAMHQALKLLKPDGLLCVTLYNGHPGGAEEKQALLDFGSSLSARDYHCAYLQLINQTNHPPELLLITKKGNRTDA